MKKYLFGFLISFCVGLSLTLLFHFVNIPTASASASSYQNYEGVLSENFSSYNDMGLNSIEGLYIENGYPVYSVTFDQSCGTVGHTGNDLVMQFLCAWEAEPNLTGYGNCFIRNLTEYGQKNSAQGINIAILCNSSNETGITYQVNSAGTHGNILLTHGFNYTIYYSIAPFKYNTSTYKVEIDTSSSYGYTLNYMFQDQDYSSLLDFDSSTNFELNILEFPFIYEENPCFDVSFGKHFLNALNYNSPLISFYYVWNYEFNYKKMWQQNQCLFYSKNNYALVTSDSSSWNIAGFERNLVLKAFNLQMLPSNYKSMVSKFYSSNFYFKINRPVSRINNTLCIYNFDYLQILSEVNGCKYQLRRDDVYYTVTYNDRLNKSYKYMYVNCDEINNIVFDEYIYFYLNFDDNDIILSTENFSTKVPFGFDFNFTFYTEPLVVNKQVYDYKFDKPSYVDMQFSLYPFYIPVLEIVENAIIFVVFYCPVISDIVNLVGLNYIIGGLLQLITFLTDFAMPQLGTFIFALFSFFVFMKFIQVLWPMAVNAGKGLSNGIKNAYHKSNRYRYKKEVKDFKREQKYQVYARKQRDKEFKKLTKKK